MVGWEAGPASLKSVWCRFRCPLGAQVDDGHYHGEAHQHQPLARIASGAPHGHQHWLNALCRVCRRCNCAPHDILKLIVVLLTVTAIGRQTAAKVEVIGPEEGTNHAPLQYMRQGLLLRQGAKRGVNWL